MGLKILFETVVGKLSSGQIVFLLIVLGLLTGGGGQMFFGELLDHKKLSVSLTELNASVNILNQSLTEQTNLLRVTRCELVAERNATDWRDCWVPLESVR